MTFALGTREVPPAQPSPVYVPAAKSGARTAAPAVSDSPVVMRVNGEPITEAEFNQFISQAPPEQQPMLATPQGRRMVADELVRVKALEQEGRKLGVDRDPAVRTQLATIEAQVLAGEAVKKLAGDPTEADLKAAYEKERAANETVELSHILVAYAGGQVPPRSGQPLEIGQAMQRAKAIETQLRGGADFAQIAKNNSDDQQNAAQGGRLGPVPVQALPPDLAPAVAALQPGQVSAPVRSTYGVHIFKAGPRSMRAYDEVRPQLEQRIKREKLEAALQNLTKNAKVDLEPKFFGDPNAAPPQNVPPLVPVQPRGNG